MFKIASSENELLQSMEKQLISNQHADSREFKKIAQAIDNLNSAAEIFEQSGLHEEAGDILDVLNNLIKKMQ